MIQGLKTAFVFSIGDPAGRGIAELLAKALNASFSNTIDPKLSVECRAGTAGIFGFIDDVLYLEYLDEYLSGYNVAIILSRHSAISGIPSLTVHHPGNPRMDASHGGRPMELSYAYPSVSRLLLECIDEVALGMNLKSRIAVSYEVTHHGPTSNKIPVVFCEIGSSEKEWIMEELHEAWVRAILRAKDRKAPCSAVAVAFGGTHYPEKFTRMALEEKICFGHTFPRYVVKDLTEEEVVHLLEQAVRKSAERTNLVVIEKKSVTSDKVKAISNKAEELGIEAVKV